MGLSRLSGVLAALAVACAGSGLGADEVPAAPVPSDPQPPPVTPSPVGYPFEAEVNATRVRIRAGGNINERELAILNKGDRVTVLEEQFGWYRIPCPQGCKGWISARYAAASADTPEIALTGDNVVLRAADNPKASAMGTFPKGTTFAVVRKHGDWFEVLCPREASAWVNAKYVTPLNGIVAPPLSTPPPQPTPVEPPRVEPPRIDPPRPPAEDPADRKAWAALEAEREAMMRRPFQEMDLEGLVVRYRALGGRAPRLADRCRARVEELQEKQRVRDQIRAGITEAQEDLQRKLDEINARYEARIAQILKERGEGRSESEFTETGWLSGVGRMINCPAAHRLNKGGRHLCFLRSARREDGGEEILELGRYLNQYVGVVGERVHVPDWGDLVVVKEIQILGESARP